MEGGFIVRDGGGKRARGSASQIHLSQAADRGPVRLLFFSFPLSSDPQCH